MSAAAARELDSPTLGDDDARRRWVLAHLPPTSPGAEDWASSDDRRWPQYWAVTPAEALRRLFREHLKVRPGQVDLRQLKAGDVVLIAKSGPYPTYPVAYVAQGMSFPEARAAFDALLREDRQ